VGAGSVVAENPLELVGRDLSAMLAMRLGAIEWGLRNRKAEI
jgi:hypothetical protein